MIWPVVSSSLLLVLLGLLSCGKSSPVDSGAAPTDPEDSPSAADSAPALADSAGEPQDSGPESDSAAGGDSHAGAESACLVSGADQTGLWERLGSPLRGEQTEQFAPSLLTQGDEIWLYYSQREGMSDRVQRLRSEDGSSWSDPEAVTGLEDFSELKHMNVVARDGGFVAMIGGGRIGSAESSDGLDWTVSGEQLLPTGDFDPYGQLYPAQSQAGDRVWYSGFDGRTFSIGLATRSGEDWTNEGALLEAQPQSEEENTAVAQSAVLEHEGAYWMWYGGYDTAETDPGPWRILSAQSSDGIQWEQRRLALDLEPSGAEAWSTREPAVALWGDSLWMAYIAMGDDGAYRLRLARCGPG